MSETTGIWNRVYGEGRKKKLDKMEQEAVKPKPKKPKKPKPKKPKKSVKQSVSDDFWGS